MPTSEPTHELYDHVFVQSQLPPLSPRQSFLPSVRSTCQGELQVRTDKKSSLHQVWCVQRRGFEKYQLVGAADASHLHNVNASIVIQSSVMIQDTAIDCAAWKVGSDIAFHRLKMLPVALNDASWKFGAIAMIQRFELLGLPTDHHAMIRGAYLLQKGGTVGSNRDLVNIYPAFSNWTDTDVSCDTAIQSYVDAHCLSHAAVVGHRYGWIVVDVTDMLNCQRQRARDESLLEHFSLIWQASDTREEIVNEGGDYSHSVNASYGRTEWYTADTTDGPTLVIYF